MNIEFDRTGVELFIKRLEKIAALQKAGGKDIALQLPFIQKDKKIKESIEHMEGHEKQDWELLKKELIRKWGQATPRRRFNKNSVADLVTNYSDKGGVQTKEEYRTFIGELEEILDYLKRMEYKDINAASGDPLWTAVSLEIQRDVAQELAHDKKLKKTKDGKALVPKLEQLKAYVEASLSVLDLEVGITKKASKIPEVKKESSNQSKTVDSSGKITSLEEEIKKLRTELNTTTKICNSTQKENVNLGWAKHIPNFTENGQK
ncbi:hypothetical protein PCASD_20069 [Puccinia coronata f. sp. avenae]|uniref:Uncharacterized protein n=1 Tax=Puccinia coronata f. sp. avenae TaxID=200324 RepID=A0A2N5TTL8_9BASI|nr:hypothetical protein PCASD_20069 [Puccinia coronata f. sp. avenae]